MRFEQQKSFGPRISLTEKQQERIIAQVNAAGLTCFVENCGSGSVYVAVGLPRWDRTINGNWYNDLDCGCGDDVAKIRLSGHDEGIRTDSTHNCIGSKGECLAALRKWLPVICEEYGPKGRAILNDGPPNKAT